MRESVWKRAASLLLCVALLVVLVPQNHVHAEGVVNRQMSGWTFPLPEECFDDITDLAGCQGTGANALYGQANANCTDSDHASLATGSMEMTVSVSSTQSVYAPASGTVYFASQSDGDWGTAAVIEVSVDGTYSYYLVLGSVTPDSSLASGSSVSAGQTIGTTSGTFHFAAAMDYSNEGSQFASGVSQMLNTIAAYGWLTASTGTGLVCVNPAATTSTSYPSSLVQSFGGPISYSFVAATVTEAPAEEAHTHTFTDTWTSNEIGHWHAATCGDTEEVADYAEHTWDGGAVTVEATTTTTGVMTYTCTVCGATKTEEIAAVHAHTFADTWTSDATYHWRVATCGDTTEVADYAEHTWGEGVVTTEATTTTTGVMTYTCTVCGATRTEEIAAVHAHTFADTWTSDATYHWRVATCGDTTDVADYAEHTWDGGVVTTEATTTTTGVMTYTCTVCGATKTEEISAVHAHTFSDTWSFDNDYHWRTATCGDTEEVADYGEHTWNEGEITTPATHTSDGVKTYTCSTCGATKTETIPASTEHTFSEAWSYDENNHWHAATCEHTDQTSEYGAHTWDEGTVTTAATHTSEGVKTYTCAVCGATKTEAIAAITDHTFDQEVVDDKYLASAATCTEPAQYYYSCVCGEKGTETFSYGEAAGHTFSTEWSYNETEHWHVATCEHTTEEDGRNPHQWDDGVITKDAGHNVDGEKVYTCQDCGYQKTEVITGQAHEYNQAIVDEKYLVSAATCESPAVYYYSCKCGEAGTETFTDGEALGHTYSEAWTYNELQHWHAATCEHTDLKSDAADHTWSDGEVTTQPTSTTKGVMTYTCTVCGATKTEEIEPTTHTHTFGTTWQSNSTYHWHAATCEHTNVVSGLAEHTWNSGVVTLWPTHTTTGTKIYTCTVCNATKTETLSQSHTYSLQVTSSTYLKSEATCTSAAVYYYSCSCGAKSSETFTFGSALGHTASSSWGKDENYHWTVCTRCGVKGDLIAHTYDSNGTCTVCGYSKSDSHVHTSHLTRVAAKAATCTTDGNSSYYVCSCGKWFTDVNCTTEITDQTSVVISATGHTDEDKNGRCDVCKVRLDTTTDYEVTEGGNTTWLNTSSQGMVFRSSADYSKFDSIQVDNATVDSSNYTVSEGSTVIELSASYLKRLSLGYHTLSIVSSDGTATTGFTIKQGATSASSGNGVWGIILIVTVLVAIAIPVTYGVIYYRKRTGMD